VELLVFDRHFVLQFSDLDLDHLIGLLDLEVSNLRAQRLDFFSDFFDKPPPLSFVELCGSCRNHLHDICAATKSTSL
jgi:hypothetical protein